MNKLKYLLAPFSWIYGSVVSVRNRLFDRDFFSSTSFTVPMICVGNLSTGGTGKTPMVEFIIENFYNDFQMAILSRGYRRNSRGFIIADNQSTARKIGDEPYQFFLKYPKVTVAVCEDRVFAVPHLLADRPETKLILLDDAYQHRAIKAGINILLTRYDRGFWDDHLLPMGSLRENPKGKSRAHIIIVTKCDPDLTLQEKSEIEKKIDAEDAQKVYFSSIDYGKVYSLFNPSETLDLKSYNVLAISGIANDKSYIQHLESQAKNVQILSFPDHYNYNLNSVEEIQKTLAEMPEPKVVLCTEKDAAKLVAMKEDMEDIPLYVQPIKTKILFNQKDELLHILRNYIQEKLKYEQEEAQY